jgi:hypothetical protein
MQCSLFVVVSATMLVPGSPKFAIKYYLVPEARIEELVSKEDLENWIQHGFTRYGNGEELKKSEHSYYSALSAFDSANWVVKESREQVFCGDTYVPPDGHLITRTFMHLPESIWLSESIW